MTVQGLPDQHPAVIIELFHAGRIVDRGSSGGWGAEPCFVPQSEPQTGLPTYISIPLSTRTVGPQLSALVSLSLVSQWKHGL